MNLFFSNFLAYFYFGFHVVLHSFISPCQLHPQPCHILARIGHTVRLGALLPSRQPARIRAALNRALGGLAESGDNFLPYNLSLEVVPGESTDGDPESLCRCVCQAIVVQGVSAVLSFPQTQEEIVQVEFMSSFLEIPFISIIEHGEPLKTQVSTCTKSTCMFLFLLTLWCVYVVVELRLCVWLCVCPEYLSIYLPALWYSCSSVRS